MERLYSRDAVSDGRNARNAFLSPHTAKTQGFILSPRQIYAERKRFFQHDRFFSRIADYGVAGKHVRIFTHRIIQHHFHVRKVVFQGDSKRFVCRSHVRHSVDLRRALDYFGRNVAKPRHRRTVAALENRGRIVKIAVRIEAVFALHFVKLHVLVQIVRLRCGLLCKSRQCNQIALRYFSAEM